MLKAAVLSLNKSINFIPEENPTEARSQSQIFEKHKSTLW